MKTKMMMLAFAVMSSSILSTTGCSGRSDSVNAAQGVEISPKPEPEPRPQPGPKPVPEPKPGPTYTGDPGPTSAPPAK